MNEKRISAKTCLSTDQLVRCLVNSLAVNFDRIRSCFFLFFDRTVRRNQFTGDQVEDNPRPTGTIQTESLDDRADLRFTVNVLVEVLLGGQIGWHAGQELFIELSFW